MWKFRILVTAIKLNVFDVVQNVHGLKELPMNGIRIGSSGKIIKCTCCHGITWKKEDSYFNRPISAKFLIKTSNEYYGDFVLMYEGMDDSRIRIG